jgi:hypothetical protein
MTPTHFATFLGHYRPKRGSLTARKTLSDF